MTDTEPPACGRPTKSGHPCRRGIWTGLRACSLHETAEDVAYREGYRDGMQDRFRSDERARASWIAEGRRQEKLDQERAWKDAHLRMTDHGRQVVEVDGYAYAWPGDEPLAIGDRVLLPENWLSRLKEGPGAFEGTVSKIGTTYVGELARIVSLISRAGFVRAGECGNSKPAATP